MPKRPSANMSETIVPGVGKQTAKRKTVPVRDQRIVKSGVSIAPNAKAERDEILLARIKQAALELFSQKGYAATTVDELAERAGLSKRSFFRYCSSKAQALWADTDTRLHKFEQHLRQRAAGASIIDHIMSAYIATFDDDDFRFVRARLRLLEGAPAADELRWRAAAVFERAIETYLVDLYGDTLMPGFAKVFASCAIAALRAAGVVWVAENRHGDMADSLKEAFNYIKAGFESSFPPPPGRS